MPFTFNVFDISLTINSPFDATILQFTNIILYRILNTKNSIKAAEHKYINRLTGLRTFSNHIFYKRAKIKS